MKKTKDKSRDTVPIIFMKIFLKPILESCGINKDASIVIVIIVCENNIHQVNRQIFLFIPTITISKLSQFFNGNAHSVCYLPLIR
jgi:hypothetical protein